MNRSMSQSDSSVDFQQALYIRVNSLIDQVNNATPDSEITESKAELIKMMQLMFERLDQAHAELTSAHDIAQNFSTFGNRTFMYGQFIELVMCLNSTEHILMYGKNEAWHSKYLHGGFESDFYSAPGVYKPAKFLRESISIEIVDSPSFTK